MKYLFLFTIGPVQTFIAQARKTRDLHSGSRLLSELISHAMETPEFEDRIFPGPDTESKPNRFIAIVNIGSTTRINNFGEEVSAKVKAKFMEIASKVFKRKIKGEKPERFNDQIENALETYWAAISINVEEGYPEIYKRAESLLASVKNYRSFNQSSEPGGRKCSLCGERNVLFHNGIRSRVSGDIQKFLPDAIDISAEIV